MRKRTFYILILLTIFVSVIPIKLQAQTVTIAQGVDLDILDPTVVHSTMDLIAQSAIFDPLVTRDRNLKLVDHLATSHQQMEPTRLRLNLRKGVTFHNGEPFNAECVRFTWKQIYAPGSVSRLKDSYASIEDIKIVDDYTVDIITKRPDPSLIGKLVPLSMVPPKYFTEVGQAKFGRSPVGTGPFEFVKWIRDDRIILKRNEKYWGGPHPTIKDVVFRVIPETQARLAALQTGEVDIVSNIAPDLVKRVDTKGKFQFKSAVSDRVIYLGFSDTPGSPVLDKRVRLAINYAIDRDSIINHILEGYGEKLATLVPKIIYGYDSSLPPYPYDLQKAKQLLTEAGYPNGFEIEMWGPSGRYMRDKEVLQALAGQLEKVGIKVNPKFIEWGTYLTKIAGRSAAPIYFLGMGFTSLEIDQYLWVIHHSTGAYSQNKDKELDGLLEAGRYEMDTNKRESIYHKAQRLLYDQAYICPLYEQKDLFGVSKRVDWSPRGDEIIFTRDIKLVK